MFIYPQKETRSRIEGIQSLKYVYFGVNMKIHEIYRSECLPESIWHIVSGSAIIYVSPSGVSNETKQLLVQLLSAINSRYPFFKLSYTVEATNHEWLFNRIVARRVNMGSLFQYNLLAARLDNRETVDAFVKEYFHFASRDDQQMLVISAPADLYEHHAPFFGGMGFMQMLVRNDSISNHTDDSDKTPEQIEAEDKIRQLVLAYCSEYHRDPDLSIVRPLTNGLFVVEDAEHPCHLLITDERELLLEAGTYVSLDLTALQKTFYCLLLEHPEGVEIKRIDEHYDRLCDIYDFFNKSQNGRDDSCKAIDNLCTMQDDGQSYKNGALMQLVSKANRRLKACLVRDAVIDDFMIQNKNGRYMVKLPQEKVEDTTHSNIFSFIRKKR